MKTLLTLILSIALLIPVTQKPKTITLTVVVDGIKNDNGYIGVALFDGYGDFPEGEALASKYVEADGSSIEVTFENLESGEYALAIIHDENGNEEMDYNEYEMPTEGFGFSNNAMGEMGPPDFSDASFTLASDNTHTIDLIYMNR
ncbi:DUF2141 domain-containing protein [Roseivirga sp.]|uniref:DUF2141 domain-containing protein n=1 Tax=Roseivirga sp. TaxID=1964215 RepID=UPI003B51AFC0